MDGLAAAAPAAAMPALQSAELTSEQLAFMNFQLMAAAGIPLQLDIHQLMGLAAQAQIGMPLPLQPFISPSVVEQTPVPQEEQKPKTTPRRRAAKGGRGKKPTTACEDEPGDGGQVCAQDAQQQETGGTAVPAVKTPKQKQPPRATTGKRSRKSKDDAVEGETAEEAAARKEAQREAEKEKKKRAARVRALKGVNVVGLAGRDENSASFTVCGSSSEYTVTLSDAGCSCSCPDHHFRRHDCKHIKVILAKLHIVEEPEKWAEAVTRVGVSVSGKLDAAEAAYLMEQLAEDE
ncbi:hypothetical protein CHLRE_11g467742v5 [Chlamydomonas reinhardtii]|uniref:SWIM-type domain-containing protein n=1 Tax=Chlamydomonas reinhardtii TaxID=3055 RepID=A0A2K3D7W1_CHLRE|nr:uncharacterized protein CHLRE_11g467742v5 [Chlamydomonas reinhardtii]PNW76621.1 hypothetical protein CHLRE_11g467742v5 [Chlamydomonas reinhardtii]